MVSSDEFYTMQINTSAFNANNKNTLWENLFSGQNKTKKQLLLLITILENCLDPFQTEEKPAHRSGSGDIWLVVIKLLTFFTSSLTLVFVGQ